MQIYKILRYDPADLNLRVLHRAAVDVAAQRMGVREARQVPERSVPALSLELTLVSVPAISGGPKTCEFTVMQGRVEFLNEKPF